MTLFPWKHVLILCNVFKLCFHLTLGVLECILMSVLRCFHLWSIPFRAQTLRTEQTAQFLWLSLQNTFFETTHDSRALYLQQHYYSWQECCCRKTSLEITIIARLTVPPLCSVKILPKWVFLSYPASVLLATHQTLAGWQGGSTLKSLDMMRIIWDFIVSQKRCALWLQVLNGHNDCLSLINSL